mmetsp:Transcript_15232/g.64304  ORF Transcript_15232/g.64304 Transcript_15232/m.64304 type:complete len:265 (-) Transcript_15232:764-1558(-)
MHTPLSRRVSRSPRRLRGNLQRRFEIVKLGVGERVHGRVPFAARAVPEPRVERPSLHPAPVIREPAVPQRADARDPDEPPERSPDASAFPRVAAAAVMLLPILWVPVLLLKLVVAVAVGEEVRVRQQALRPDEPPEHAGDQRVGEVLLHERRHHVVGVRAPGAPVARVSAQGLRRRGTVADEPGRVPGLVHVAQRRVGESVEHLLERTLGEVGEVVVVVLALRLLQHVDDLLELQVLPAPARRGDGFAVLLARRDETGGVGDAG